MSFGSGPGGCQSSANHTEKLQSKCWCAVWQATAVRLADVSFMERILVLRSRISQWDPAQESSCFSAWRQSWAYPTSGCCVCEGFLFFQTYTEVCTPVSCISWYCPGSSSFFLLLLHSTASNNWQDSALTPL